MDSSRITSIAGKNLGRIGHKTNMGNSDTANSIIKMKELRNFSYPFVANYGSFVELKNPVLKPIIHKKIPFITNRPVSGFTLIELMVTVAIAIILGTLAIPSMRTFIQNSRITTQANELLSDLSFARSEAVKRAANVTVCKSDNSTEASPTCSTTGAWATGRVVYIDSNANGDIDAGEDVLRVREVLEGANTLNPATAINTIVYTRTGATTAGAKIDFSLCDVRAAAYGRLVSIESTGRVVLSRPPASCT